MFIDFRPCWYSAIVVVFTNKLPSELLVKTPAKAGYNMLEHLTEFTQISDYQYINTK